MSAASGSNNNAQLPFSAFENVIPTVCSGGTNSDGSSTTVYQSITIANHLGDDVSVNITIVINGNRQDTRTLTSGTQTTLCAFTSYDIITHLKIDTVRGLVPGLLPYSTPPHFFTDSGTDAPVAGFYYLFEVSPSKIYTFRWRTD